MWISKHSSVLPLCSVAVLTKHGCELRGLHRSPRVPCCDELVRRAVFTLLEPSRRSVHLQVQTICRARRCCVDTMVSNVSEYTRDVGKERYAKSAAKTLIYQTGADIPGKVKQCAPASLPCALCSLLEPQELALAANVSVGADQRAHANGNAGACRQAQGSRRGAVRDL